MMWLQDSWTGSSSCGIQVSFGFGAYIYFLGPQWPQKLLAGTVAEKPSGASIETSLSCLSPDHRNCFSAAYSPSWFSELPKCCFLITWAALRDADEHKCVYITDQGGAVLTCSKAHGDTAQIYSPSINTGESCLSGKPFTIASSTWNGHDSWLFCVSFYVFPLMILSHSWPLEQLFGPSTNCHHHQNPPGHPHQTLQTPPWRRPSQCGTKKPSAGTQNDS